MPHTLVTPPVSRRRVHFAHYNHWSAISRPGRDESFGLEKQLINL
jgi:hypothetical protein